ncbi:MAG: hypothetical protein ACPHRO_03225 [Nannocystaceae bacterium]
MRAHGYYGSTCPADAGEVIHELHIPHAFARHKDLPRCAEHLHHAHLLQSLGYPTLGRPSPLEIVCATIGLQRRVEL